MIHEQLTAPASEQDVSHAAPSALSREADRISTFAAIGGLLLAAALGIVFLSAQSRAVIFIAFLFVLVAAPLPSAYLVYFNEQVKPFGRLSGDVVLAAAKSLLLAVLTALIVATVLERFWWPQPMSILTLAVTVLASLGVIALQSLRRASSFKQVSQHLDALIIVALAVVVFVYSPYDPAAPQPIGLIQYATAVSQFGKWLLLGMAWTLAGIWMRRHESWAFPRRARLAEACVLSAAGFVVIGMYDDSHFVDFSHYAPLVGPAMHAMRGGIPMVNTYSQYGFLPFLIDIAAFTVFEPTFGTAAVVERSIDFAYFAVALAIVYFVSRRRLSALWFFIPALFVQVTSHSTGPDGMWNMHALPMTLGGRWLLPACVALMLVMASKASWARWVVLLIIALASLSSVEILAFTLAPWGYCLLLESLRARSVTFFVRQVALALAAIAAAQLTMVIAIYLATGAVVDYRPYFDAVLQHRPSEDSDWSVPFVPRYALWLPIVCTYFLVLAAAGYRAVRGIAPASIVDRLVPVVVWGLGPLAYFFGRPQEGTLNIAVLSFAIVAIGIAEMIFMKPRRFGPAGPVLFSVMAVAFAFVTADGFEHFMRPYDPSRGNASFLRRCLSKEGCGLFDIPRNIALALRTLPLDPRTKVGLYVGGGKRSGRERLEEAISMLRTVSPNDRYVGMLTDFYPYRFADSDMTIGMAAFMTTGQWYAWGISSPGNDGHSPLISRQILQRVSSTPSGLLVIVSRQREEWLPINYAIFEALRARCQLRLVEDGKYHQAYRTENCSG